MPPPTNPDRILAFDLVEGAWKGVAGPVTRAAVDEGRGPAGAAST